MSTKRLYIGKQDQSDLDIEDWLADKIPPPPADLACEHDDCAYVTTDAKGNRQYRIATDYAFRIEDGHVCYSYVCQGCADECEPSYLGYHDYPTTKDGYAVAPRHCT